MTPEQLQALREKLKNLTADQRSLLDGLTDPETKETREFSSDENTTYENRETEIDRLDAQISREERQLDRERGLSQSRRQFTPDSGAAGSGSLDDHADPAEQRQADDQVLEIAEARGIGRLTPEQEKTFRAIQARAFASFVKTGTAPNGEIRSLIMGQDTKGGNLVAPVEFVSTLLQNVDDRVHIRNKATVRRLKGSHSLGAPSIDTDLNDATWTAEVEQVAEDSALEFGNRMLTPHDLAKLVKISRKLIDNSDDVEGIVQQRMAHKFSRAQEAGFITGDGVQKPLGLMTANSDGIPTSRDVAFASATAFDANTLIDATFELKEQYQNDAEWIFHRYAVKNIRKLKDNDGQYLWQPSIKDGEPGTILGNRYTMSEFMPAVFTTGLYAGILGDFSFYWIVDSMQLEVQRLVEKYAETNQYGYIGRMGTDGMPVLAEAFVRVKMG